MELKNKNAVIYGAAGAIGSSVAIAFAKEGARVFLAGRTRSKLEIIANQIIADGGRAEIAEVDALNKDQVETQLTKMLFRAGSIDISFNAISINDMQGAPLIAMEYDQFILPIITAMTSHFITTTAAVKHMSNKAGGVILAITANAARKPYNDSGGFGVACAAIEGYCRQLSLEAGKKNIRVVCIRSAGSPDSQGVDKVFTLHAKNAGITCGEFEDNFAERTMLKRLPRLREIANTAVLMASDKASAITAAVINATCGELAD